MNEFQRPYLLLLFIPLLGVLFYSLYKKSFSQILKGEWNRAEKNQISETISFFYNRFGIFLDSLLFLAGGLLIFASAGPGTKYTLSPDETNGIDIILALDISGSMVQSYDFLPYNRLTVSKSLLKEFIQKRKEDRLGFVVFAGAAYLQSPLTSDRETLLQLIDEVNETSIEEQGTAIGDALMLSTYRLKNSQAKSKVIVLLTDGVSNTGKVDPDTASFTTKAYKTKVYSIGIGKEESQFEVNYDALQKISTETGGRFYRAESPEDLQEVLNEIDSLEKDILPKKPSQVAKTEFPEVLFWFFLVMVVSTIMKVFPWKERL
ncbi:BatA [Leptospira ryugenii]|uniref:BatA n=1 Tax=Leptospira ryugenii TaxID=1917863 RepID=A0A2P2E4X3_9LEPT|nr:VWA domain-containing protein [Leptospira ryugenii]GBF51919.1 BatA [Leptospira ryugenii]